jgi:hypothetical protein
MLLVSVSPSILRRSGIEEQQPAEIDTRSVAIGAFGVAMVQRKRSNSTRALLERSVLSLRCGCRRIEDQ